MHLNPYGEYAVLMAASLANDWPGDRDALEARTRDYGMIVDFPILSDDLANTRHVIDDWLELVDADSSERRAELLNLHMATVTAYPRMTNHAGDGWHIHYRDDRQFLPVVLRAVISVGTALHLTTRGMDRLRRCAAGEFPGDACVNVVVDVTRNGRQKYCSVRCANRAAVRRHRARTR
ncbi:hypothetical protein GCM10011490_09210 [Pseudoclavibacter endophyticus]|uniref:CGNR zinc finger domain-containing protein n=1 Tax=Pseudoclavibacter endophyticus TaxID=1778590 RepID=A0A6H9WNF5_9MICO|nr:CGNR zinc finger domain-containing protein [Pseudoclavibacter endophyticus]KAB1649618.1 CGNR zinc finger domain-containing protein [Pseudoclavibacter endophyticus]GGA61183.1 hypothetical protein GCM10011490_09210 [Pseudoclavibacter endophyticus]